jgi:hypothetical protein
MLVTLTPYKISRLPMLMPMACQEFIFLIREGDREKWREGKEYSLYRILIRMKLITKTPISLVRTREPGENPHCRQS